MEKMTKRATIMGCACVITSKLTVEQIEDFRKYLPDALKLMDEACGKEEFSIELDDGPGSIVDGKATYSRTKTPDRMATITLLLDPEIEDKAEMVRTRIGASLIALDRLEARLLDQLGELADTMHQMDEMIGQL